MQGENVNHNEIKYFKMNKIKNTSYPNPLEATTITSLERDFISLSTYVRNEER